MKNKILVSFILFVGFTLQMDAQRDFRGSCHPNKKERIKDGIKSGVKTKIFIERRNMHSLMVRSPKQKKDN